MEKHILGALAFLACGTAAAQNSVMIFGAIDAGVARISATGAGSSTGLASGGSTTSRIGFRGNEDLGGGLNAGFWLEGQINNDTGGGATQTSGLDFTRRSTISLSGPFGEVRLGRDFAPTYHNLNQFDTFGQRGIGQLDNTGTVRAGVGSPARNSNSISYFLPNNLGGFYGQVQFALSEQTSDRAAVAGATGISTSAANAATKNTGSYYGARAGFANGPLDVSVAYGVFQDTIRTVGTSFFADDLKIANIGASYNLGFVTPRFVFQTEKIGGRGAVPESRINMMAIGASAPIGGVGALRFQVAHFNQSDSPDDWNKFSIGYAHNLSKRTALYVDVARLNNKGAGRAALSNMTGSVVSPTPTAGGNSTGYIVGVRHTF